MAVLSNNFSNACLSIIINLLCFHIYLDIYFNYPTKFLFLFIIAILNRFYFHFVITLEANNIGAEGAKALAEALKLNKNLTSIILSKFMRLFQHIITVISS